MVTYPPPSPDLKKNFFQQICSITNTMSLLKHNVPTQTQCPYSNTMSLLSITDTMSLLKPIHKTSILIPYDQLFIQTFHHNGNLITEQSTGEQNPLFQLAIDTMLTSATT